MEFFIQQLINGITLGGLYALIALGYTMVYGVIQLINFAHGEFFAAGGYVGVILLSFFTGLGYMETHPILCLAAAFVLTMGYCAFLAVGVEKVAYKPLRRQSRLAALLSALGMSIFLSNGLMLTQGVYDKAYPGELFQGGVDFGNITIGYLQMTIVGMTAVLLVGLNILVFRTKIGMAMRATAQDKIMSSLVSISSNRIISLTFAIGAGLAAAAGIMVGLYYGSVRYDMGFSARYQGLCRSRAGRHRQHHRGHAGRIDHRHGGNLRCRIHLRAVQGRVCFHYPDHRAVLQTDWNHGREYR
jgi:branched-chain amino acid transport system permease protein